GAPRGSRRRRHGPPRLSVTTRAPAGDAVVEVRPEPLPHGAGEPGLRPPALGVPHRIPRVSPRGARARELRPELRSVAATRASRRRSASRPARALDDPPPLDDHRVRSVVPPEAEPRAPPAGHLPWR